MSQEGVEENERPPIGKDEEAWQKDVGEHASLHTVDVGEILSSNSTTACTEESFDFDSNPDPDDGADFDLDHMTIIDLLYFSIFYWMIYMNIFIFF